MDKRGSEKYYLLVSLILGLIVLGLIIFFIYREYFTAEEYNLETCKQSILLRQIMPEQNLIVGSVSAKDTPLKCKTEVININYLDKSKAERQFADTIARWRYSLGDWDYNIFPVVAEGSVSAIPDWERVHCMVLARIHIDQGVSDRYSGDNRIDFREALDMSIDGQQTYWRYLNPGGKDNTFNYFKDWAESFRFDKLSTFKSEISPDNKAFYFPQYYNPAGGDILIIYAEPSTASTGTTGSGRAIKKYMFFVQTSDIAKLKEPWADYQIWGPVPVCGSFEVVPA